MKIRVIAGAAGMVVLAAATVGLAGPVLAAGSPAASEYAPACPGPAAPGFAHCTAIQLLNPAANWHGVHAPALPSGKRPGNKPVRSSFAGYTPADLQLAYGLTTASGSDGSGHTVAVVDAYNDPNALTDLNVYRSTEGLTPVCQVSSPPCAGPTFTKLNQTGGTSYPASSTSWSEEISLDLDMVSAICPNCNILLVEANSASFANLTTAEATALSYSGVDAVSNSYGGSEFSGETAYNSAYNSTTAAVTVSAGDQGYGVEFPAADPYVVAVGGTTLTSPSDPGGQTVWSGSGSGCSAYEPIPVWQPVTQLCANRTVADVSADANPSTGVAVYDTYGESGWLVFGGTSVASPIVASVYALAGYSGSGSPTSTAAKGLYASNSGLTEVTSGSNTHHCTVYLCNAADSLSKQNGVLYYNGPTGNGTPNGLGGF